MFAFENVMETCYTDSNIASPHFLNNQKTYFVIMCQNYLKKLCHGHCKKSTVVAFLKYSIF